MTKGILITADGKQWLRQALLSAWSVSVNSPGIPCTILTQDSPESVHAVSLEDPRYAEGLQYAKVELHNRPGPTTGNQYMLPRLRNWLLSPYDITLALDSDTVILDDLTPLFDMGKRFDACIAHGVRPVRRYYKATRQGALDPDEIPYAAGTLQGGVVLFNKSTEKGLKFVNDVIRIYQENGYYDDQIAMMQAIWRDPGIRFFHLPKDYNFSSKHDLKRWEHFKFTEGIPTIFHYTQHKSDDVMALVSEYVVKAQGAKEHYKRHDTYAW